MRIFTYYILYYFLLFIGKIENTECYSIRLKNPSNIITMNKTRTIINSNANTNFVINNTNIVNIINTVNSINKDKILVYGKLLRINNILPTFLLNVLAGWLTIPNYKLFLNKNFWFFSLITQLTMMNSMVVNDLFDLKIDLINNSNRPLVNKEISIKEARCLYISTNCVISFLSIIFFKKNHFYKYIYAINTILFLYTPYLKKIIFIKNIACASVVSSTIILTSKSITLNDKLALSIASRNFTPYLNLINITSSFLFLSSLYIELLLDIKDIKGDLENNIITIPNYFGEKNTLNLLTSLFFGNLLYYSIIFYRNHNYKLFIGFLLSNTHFLKNLIALRTNVPCSYKMISSSVKETTKSLLIFIIFTLLM